MSADIVNLRQARKRKARDAQDKTAAENREKFGRSKSDRRHDAANKLLEKTRLDGSIRERPTTRDDC